MKVTIFGATGTVGTALLEETLAAGHDVTALVRSPEKISDYSERVNVVVGDYFDPDIRIQALQGADAVLSTIGPPMKRKPNNGEYANAMVELVGQMQDAGIERRCLGIELCPQLSWPHPRNSSGFHQGFAHSPSL